VDKVYVSENEKVALKGDKNRLKGKRIKDVYLGD
jgi:hypothetical protein|tara:strand:- start:1533 stop:1634 length:102 start_codon:yes stop_codon:yes gene_type:complete